MNGFISIAMTEALKSDHIKMRMGCVIYSKKRILSLGHNCQRMVKKLHPKFQNWKGSVHAEVDAIIKAKKDLRGSTLLVVRINKKNELRMAKPCNDCMKYIEYVGIKRIYYSLSNPPFIEKIEIKEGKKK